MQSTNDLQIVQRRQAAESIMFQNSVTDKNIDRFVEQRINQYI